MIAALHLAAVAASLLIAASALFTIIAILRGNWPLILCALKKEVSQ